MALNLVPNKIVGYRINPDWYSFNVVLVKQHGPGSKNAGAEYMTPVGYYRTLDHAAGAIFDHVLRQEGLLAQDELEALEGSCADVRGLQQSVNQAKAEVGKAVAELQSRIDALGLTQKGLVKALGAPAAEDELDTEEA